MARIRSIHPDACDSEKLSMLSDSAERTFFRLLTHADDDGRGEDRTKLLAAKLYPLHDDKDAETVDADLDEIQRIGLLLRYRVGGKHYFAIPTFKDWQKPRHPTASKLPPPEDADPEPDDNPTAASVTVTAERGNATDKRHEPFHGVGGVSGVGGGEGGDDADAPSPIDLEFRDFWDRYPRHSQNGKPGGGGSRRKAHQRWWRMSKRERDLALSAVDNYREWVESPDGEFAAHATTWLNEARWEQWQEPADATGGQDVDALLGDRGHS